MTSSCWTPGLPITTRPHSPIPTVSTSIARGAAHVGFGYGLHYCIGAALARMELKTVFTQLIPRFPTLRLAVDASTLTAGFHSLSHGLVGLPVTW